MNSCPICYQKLEKEADKVLELPDGNFYPSWKFHCCKHGVFYASEDLLHAINDSKALKNMAEGFLYPVDGQQRLLRLFEVQPGLKSVSCNVV